MMSLLRFGIAATYLLPDRTAGGRSSLVDEYTAIALLWYDGLELQEFTRLVWLERAHGPISGRPLATSFNLLYRAYGATTFSAVICIRNVPRFGELAQARI